MVYSPPGPGQVLLLHSSRERLSEEDWEAEFKTDLLRPSSTHKHDPKTERSDSTLIRQNSALINGDAKE